MQRHSMPRSIPHLKATMLCEWWEERDDQGNVVARNLASWTERSFAGHRGARREFRLEMMKGAGGRGDVWLQWMQKADYSQMAQLWNTTAIALGYVMAGSVMVLTAVLAAS